MFRKKIIYDFDDAIWLEDHKERGSMLAKLKWKSKVGSICKWSFKVSAGNAYLADHARKFNHNVIVNPTTIDTQLMHNPELYKMLSSRKKQEMCIGWTGTHSTLQYLSEILPVLRKLEEQYEFKFRVISNKRPDFELRNAEFVPWQKESEIEDLMAIDIGIMPLTDDPWSRGKCGFKALQYMALEKPTVVSPVGINRKIIEHGVTGYHCTTLEDWHNYLLELLINQKKRIEMGKKGRQFVKKHYSLESNGANFLSLFGLP
ncbi:MAG: glycosyltransferase [Bacteroidota bacterium]